MSISKGGKNLLAGDGYAGLSETALYYHRRHHQARARDERLHQPGHELVQAPGTRLRSPGDAGLLGQATAPPRSASRTVANPKARRIEVRFPDPSANPYLGFAAMLMAGLDGIQNKIHPGDALDKDLYDLPPEEAAQVPTVSHSLEMALAALNADRAFLTAGGVFDDDMIDAYIELKQEDIDRIRMTTHPVEFDMYYSC